MSARRALAALFAVLLALFAAAPAHAQSPRRGQDSVDVGPNGEALHVPPVPASYRVEQRGPLRISYPPSAGPQITATLARVDRDARSVADQLGLTTIPPLDIRLVPDPDVMRALAPVEAPPPAYAVGVAYPSLGLTLVSASAPQSWDASDMPRVLRHEISHLLLAAATGHAAIPRWFSEGVAIEQAAEHSFERFRTLAVATFTGGLVPLRQLDEGFHGGSDQVSVAYAQSADFVSYLLHHEGSARFPLLLQQLRDGADLEAAARRTYGKTLGALEAEWRREVALRFLTAPLWASTGLLWMVGAALMVAAMFRKRRHAREVMARWAHEEASLAALGLTVVSPGASAVHEFNASGEVDQPTHGHAQPTLADGDDELNPERPGSNGGPTLH